MPSSTCETFDLGPFVVPRVWTGLWQLSSNAWGSASVPKIRKGMRRYVDQGYTAFADHYGGAEIIFGQFKNSLPSPGAVIGATKWCVFKRIIPTRSVVRAAVIERMERMRSRQVDLLQFHWQDYSDKNYLAALNYLLELQDEGLIASIGLCNFDTIRLDEICTQLGPGAIVSNQVQFSIIDTRPLHGMADVCEKHGVKLLTYGTLCGGFLADKWLGAPEPDSYSEEVKLTPSQRKYLDMIVKAWGNWDLFQTLLLVLRRIGDRHNRSIANIATRWVLDHHFVGAVIIGARLGLSEHPEENHQAFGFRLSSQDNEAIEAVLRRSNSRTIITSIGDCGAEYR
ncbi:hypothetical protein CVT24_002969 [Panaeolus cyanescens]|uniref:NADP-dependent oxidoreductase domain-containing protein n=1 Tax=Panaeolus cyanescens TaxID=181874 RepID=A0A409W8W0_9AGAR|nr:hypothetical protein CVT24_002969 [Panaeolus cyanescens]